MREFPTQRPLKKHEEKIRHINLEADIEFFKQCGTEPVILQVPNEIAPAEQAAYKGSFLLSKVRQSKLLKKRSCLLFFFYVFLIF